MKDIKIFLKKKKKIEGESLPDTKYKNLLEEQKQKLLEYKKKYYLTHNK